MLGKMGNGLKLAKQSQKYKVEMISDLVIQTHIEKYYMEFPTDSKIVNTVSI